MNKNPIKEKLRAGEAAVGVFCNLPSPAAAEMLGIAGFDFIIIDAEHSPGGYGHLRAHGPRLPTPPAWLR